MEHTQSQTTLNAQRKAFMAVSSKHGLSANVNVGGSTDELHAQRKEARRLVNKIQTDAQGREFTEDEALAIDFASGIVAKATGMIDDLDQIQSNRVVGDDWRDDRGASIRVLDKTDTAAKKGDRAPFSFGNYLRAMVNAGPRSTELRNALAEGTDSTGGFMTPDILSNELIDRMRARQVCIAAGARTVMLESDKTRIVRVATDPLLGWRFENAAVAESQPTFEAVDFVPRSLAVLVKVSVELLEDAVNMSDALTQIFANSLAVEVDRVCLNGSGVAPQPLGLLTGALIPASLMETSTGGAAVNGARFGENVNVTPYGPLLTAITVLRQANAPEPTAMVTNPIVLQALDSLIDAQKQPQRMPDSLARLTRYSTTSIPTNLVQGSSAGVCSAAIIGDFTKLLIGMRSGIRIEVMRERFMDNLQVGFIAHLRMDVQVAQPLAFTKLMGIKTA